MNSYQSDIYRKGLDLLYFDNELSSKKEANVEQAVLRTCFCSKAKISRVVSIEIPAVFHEKAR